MMKCDEVSFSSSLGWRTGQTTWKKNGRGIILQPKRGFLFALPHVAYLWQDVFIHDFSTSDLGAKQKLRTQPISSISQKLECQLTLENVEEGCNPQPHALSQAQLSCIVGKIQVVELVQISTDSPAWKNA